MVSKYKNKNNLNNKNNKNIINEILIWNLKQEKY